MKLKAFAFLMIIAFTNAVDAQTIETKMTYSKGDEQGLEIPKSLVLRKDIDAYRNAIETWYKEDLKKNANRADWFADAHFGCFVHWGVYSRLSGEWNGTGTLGYAEHIMRSRMISLADYKSKVVIPFDPSYFDADAWMKLASEAGMKYFIITAKHHDGFAMYPSNLYPYDIRLTKMKQDPMKELSIAAKKYGIKFGFYYSHAFDWEHPDAPGNDWDYDNPGGDKLLHGANWWETFPEFLPKAEKYVDGKSIPQILELIRNYHPDILWFDRPHKLPIYLNLRILKAIRDADPTIVVNGRLARVGNINFGDYANTGDRAAFFRPTAGLWEAVPTTNESYGYNKFDHSHKSPRHFIQLLASAAAKGGNILLNIGPKGDGTIDPKDVEILTTIGKWMKVNGESIYSVKRNPLSQQSWGEITRKGNDLYLHVFQWPSDGSLVVGGLETHIKKAMLLGDPKHAPLSFSKINRTDLSIALGGIKPDTSDTVIKLVCDSVLNSNTVRLLSSTENNSLLVFDAQTPKKGFTYGDGKRNRNFATNWKSADQYLQWGVRLSKDASYNLVLEYNTAAKADSGVVLLTVDKTQYRIDYQPTTDINHNRMLHIPAVKMTFGVHSVKLQLESFKGTQAMQPLQLIMEPIKK